MVAMFFPTLITVKRQQRHQTVFSAKLHSRLSETKVMSACLEVAPPVAFHIFPTGVAIGHSVFKLLPVVLVFYKR